MQIRLVWAAWFSMSTLSIGFAQEVHTGTLPPSPAGTLTVRFVDEWEAPVQRRHRPASAAVNFGSGEPLPADAQALIKTFDSDAEAIRQRADQEVQSRRTTLISALQTLQDQYTRDAKLDEAVAIRDRIRAMKVAHLNPLPDPGNLVEYAGRIGDTFYFEVVGATGYAVWGSEVYTYDSHLATAAVHAGVLKPGQPGIVKVTMVKSPEAHQGSSANGVTTSNWGSYPASFTVECAVPGNVRHVPAAPPLKGIHTPPVNRKI